GLDAAEAVLVHREAVQAFQAAPHGGMVEAVATQGECDQRVHPGRLDAAPRAVRLLPLEDALLGPAEGGGAQPADGTAAVAAQQAVDGDERVLPTPLRRWHRGAAGAQLVDREARAADGPVRRDDREGDDGLARPA